MAFVGISKHFVERVEDKINKMREAEIKSIGETPTISITDSEPWVLRTLWGEHLHLLEKMPEKWLTKVENIRFQVKVNQPDLKEDDQWFSFSTKAPKHVYVPPNTDWYMTHKVDSSIPEIAPVFEYATKHKEIHARWTKVKQQVTDFLYSCKSANEAVKLWPDVKMYFDKSDIDRLDAKTVRSGTSESEAAKKLAELDTTSLTSAAVIARMSGAQV